MEMNSYKIFLEVARQNNISKAAKELGYTQSGISHTIKRLEEEMGLILFERNRGGVFLTAAGRELYPLIQNLASCQEVLNQTLSSILDIHQGTLNIGTYSSTAIHWLPAIIQQFKKDYPSIIIHFKEGGNEDIIRWLTNREVDMGFLSAGFEEPLEWIPLREDPLLAVLPPDYPADRPALPLEEFNGKTFIISAKGTDIDIHRTLTEHNIQPDIQYSAIDDLTIVSMVACSLGVSILPALVLTEQTHKVMTLPLDPPARRELGIALPSLELASPAALKFIEYVKEYLEVE